MSQSQIKWKHGDYIRLGQAVAQFNRKINKLQQEEKKLYLPELIDYKQQKEKIYTRNELNRFINSLKRFSIEGAESLYTTEAGEEITKWERRELAIKKGIATRRLTQELQKLNEPLESGYSRVQMGSTRAKEIEAQIKNLNKLEIKTGYEFKRLRQRIHNIGVSDYEMRIATIYRENYLSMIETYKNFDNYDKLIDKLNQLENPIAFYNFISQNELLADITYMYDMAMNFGIMGVNEQTRFNQMLESIGIDTEEYEEIN